MWLHNLTPKADDNRQRWIIDAKCWSCGKIYHQEASFRAFPNTLEGMLEFENFFGKERLKAFGAKCGCQKKKPG